MRMVGMQRAPWRRGALLTLAALALALALGACGSGGAGDQKGEIVITCGSCMHSPSDTSLEDTAWIADRFNAAYRGRYHVKAIKNQYAGSSPDRLQYYQRLALADDLPDVFQVNPPEARALARTGKLLDFAPIFQQDPAWKATFYPETFAPLTDAAGHIWAMPQSRTVVGIFYNRAIFRAAGIAAYPQTWAEVEADCRKIKAIGKACFAMDGDWTTLLMWANLLGTQPAGKAFLDGGNRSGDYSANPAVVRATETLKRWHTDGFTNADAFSGEYQNAATAFIRGQAAMVANGPWMVGSDITTKNAIRGLYDEVGYESSPGWTADKQGIMLISAESSLASGTHDPRKQEALVAYLKFLMAHAQGLHQIQVEDSFLAVKFTPTPAEAKTLEPLNTALTRKVGSLAMIYPHAFYNAPEPFEATWKNLWPAYVKGQLSTHDFLSKLASDSQSTTG